MHHTKNYQIPSMETNLLFFTNKTTMRILSTSISLWMAVRARAWSDPSFTDGVFYSQSFDLDLSSDNDDDPPFRVTSTLDLATDGAIVEDDDSMRCYVSSHTMISGDAPCQMTSLEDFFSATEDEDEHDASDDDDDDDDDGHSSMLSNASLKRSRSAVGVGSTSEETRVPEHKEERRKRTRARKFFQSARLFGTKKRKSMMALETLRVRGGADSTATKVLNSEVARKLFVTALVTLVYEGMIGHILEFVKIRMQVGDATYAQVITDITAEKGLAGFWDGFVPWGVVQAIFKGAVFGLAHSAASGYLLPLADDGRLPLVLAMTLAGGIGGGFQGYVLSPTLLLKTRVMTNPVFREKMSALQTTILSFCVGMEVIRKEGILTLMKGANIFATKRVFDWATRFFFSDLIESRFKSVKGGVALTLAEKSVASLLGGVASTYCTLPLDVLVAKTQDAKKAGVKVSAWKLFHDELQQKGWAGLRNSYMRGFEARLFHVCTTTVAIKTGTPLVYDAIFGPKETA